MDLESAERDFELVWLQKEDSLNIMWTFLIADVFHSVIFER